MTKQRINEIRRRTIGKAIEKVHELDFGDRQNAVLQLGIIFGELDSNLEHELYKELNFQKRVYDKLKANNEGTIEEGEE